MKLSIVIPVFNKWNFTKSCLIDLSMLPKETHEIIVVDNGSTDETNKELSGSTDIVYHRNEENLGFAKACNIGYGRATGDIIMFLNNDIRVQSNHSNWTNAVFEAVEKYPNSLIGPTMGQLDANLNFVKEANTRLDGNSYMSGWCLAAHRNTWKKLDLANGMIFSEDFFCYYEDTDLSFRARRLKIGFEVIAIPVVHFGKITSKQLNTYELYAKAKKIFVKKWRSK